MKRIRERLANEQGSALLLVMFAVVLLGLLFGGLFFAIEANQKQVITHKLQVQAEYDAQKMMDWALHYYYEDDGKGEKLAAELDEEGCLTDDTNTEDKVCLIENEDTPKTLVATGTESTPDGELKQTSTIQFPLTKEYSRGSICENEDDFFLRALNLGSDFDLTRGTGGVQVDGGVYLHEDSKIFLSGNPVTETLSVPVSISGYVSAELQWAGQSNDNPFSPSLDLLGDSAEVDTSCSPGVEWSDYLIDLATQVADNPQKVDVYKFTGDYIAEESTGSKKAKEEDSFEETEQTLSQVLENKRPKIVLIEGNVILGTKQTTNAWLIVYPKAPDERAHIYLPDGFRWEHRGAITAYLFGRYTADTYTSEWPKQYQLSIGLSAEQAELYDQH